MINKHISDFKYRDFFKDDYPEGDAGVNEMIEDTKRLVRYIFENYPDIGERVIDNIYVVSGGDAKNQLRLLNGCIDMSSPIVYEEEQERVMSHDELEASFYLRNMAMNIIDMVLDMSAKRILQMQESIHNLTEALAISTRLLQSPRRGDVDEQSNP